MNELHFARISSSERIAEPTFVSLPVPLGTTTEAESVRILDRGLPLARQARPLVHWPDGSIKWLLVAFQPDLPADAARNFQYDFKGGPVPVISSPLQIKERGEGWQIDTGPLQIQINPDNFSLFDEVCLRGRLVLGAGGMNGGFFYQENDHLAHTMLAGQTQSCQWIERGPIRARLVVRGVHGGRQALHYRVALEFYAGKPWVRVQYQVIAVGPREAVEISHWGLRISPDQPADRCEAAMGHYRCAFAEAEPGQPKTIAVDGEKTLYTAFESIPETYGANFWADWNNSELGGLGVSVFQAMQNFPKAIRCSKEGLEIDLLPADQPPLTLRRGVAKTHVLQLHFHDPDESLMAINHRSFLFQMPDLPRLPSTAYRLAGVFNERLPARRFDALDHWLHQRAVGVPRAFGMLHWGDYVDANYSNQGRGRGRGVWLNGEYDVPHVYYLLHVLLGERWLRDFAAVSARHWMDVDFCHDSDNPLRRGGLISHSADHVTGGVDISHEWLDGLLDHWHLTGEEEALETARAIGENILRQLDQLEFREKQNITSCRRMGWALRALGPLWQETGEPRFRQACERIIELFNQRFQQLGGILDQYTEHNLGRVPFMIALTCESMRQWAEIGNDQRPYKLIIDQAEDLLQNAIGVGGFPFYKELPFLHRYPPMLQTMLPFIEAFRLTGDHKFMRPAYRIVEGAMRSPRSIAGGKTKTLCDDALLIDGTGWASFDIQPMLAFYAVMSELNDSRGEPLLKALDFRTDF